MLKLNGCDDRQGGDVGAGDMGWPYHQFTYTFRALLVFAACLTGLTG